MIKKKKSTDMDHLKLNQWSQNNMTIKAAANTHIYIVLFYDLII